MDETKAAIMGHMPHNEVPDRRGGVWSSVKPKMLGHRGWMSPTTQSGHDWIDEGAGTNDDHVGRFWFYVRRRGHLRVGGTWGVMIYFDSSPLLPRSSFVVQLSAVLPELILPPQISALSEMARSWMYVLLERGLDAEAEGSADSEERACDVSILNAEWMVHTWIDFRRNGAAARCRGLRGQYNWTWMNRSRLDSIELEAEPDAAIFFSLLFVLWTGKNVPQQVQTRQGPKSVPRPKSTLPANSGVHTPEVQAFELGLIYPERSLGHIATLYYIFTSFFSRWADIAILPHAVAYYPVFLPQFGLSRGDQVPMID
ncbi:hypothetical protein BU15DRAFT_67074 [Melanogaster broomeanus]|nr:hypothetical protein BU15DRAFT_67074 [Melanogaster broomeanus]